MNYDVWGSWSPTAGPNAPLYDSCAPQQEGSAQSAVKAWTGANFPANQVNGSPISSRHNLFVYAIRFFSACQATDTVTPYHKAQRFLTMRSHFTHHSTRVISPLVRARPTAPLVGVPFLSPTNHYSCDLPATDQCGNTGGASGIWDFNALITAGFLQNNNGKVTPASGMLYTFDNCSQTVCSFLS